jgi:hypothetical protein
LDPYSKWSVDPDPGRPKLSPKKERKKMKKLNVKDFFGGQGDFFWTPKVLFRSLKRSTVYGISSIEVES